jgi:hypothetical protein
VPSRIGNEKWRGRAGVKRRALWQRMALPLSTSQESAGDESGRWCSAVVSKMGTSSRRSRRVSSSAWAARVSHCTNCASASCDIEQQVTTLWKYLPCGSSLKSRCRGPLC